MSIVKKVILFNNDSNAEHANFPRWIRNPLGGGGMVGGGVIYEKMLLK